MQTYKFVLNKPEAVNLQQKLVKIVKESEQPESSTLLIPPKRNFLIVLAIKDIPISKKSLSSTPQAQHLLKFAWPVNLLHFIHFEKNILFICVVSITTHESP